MKSTETNFAKVFLNTALVLLLLGIIFGCLASATYLWPGFLKDQLGFISMRPLHVSSALFWILIGATACIYYGLQTLFPGKVNQKITWVQWTLWMIAIVGMLLSYFTGQFGGREYWEFPPVFALPVAISWAFFIYQFFKITSKFSNWPVYMWMWVTGIVFFMFTFLEGYLWLFPYFRNALINDITIQWKVNGSMVGAWNQIIYGTSYFLMDKISGNAKVGYSKMAFAMYFLGFFNLCFNWGHHIYSLPTEPFVRYVGYTISMTEWVFFARIIYNWKKDLQEIQKHYSYYPYRFLVASNFWVLLNLGLALLMSIPALNLYTHGTHVTVAHAMGTTIGINTMILLSAAFMIFGNNFSKSNPLLNLLFWALQIGLFIFWISLIAAGIQKGLWQLQTDHISFGDMMKELKPWFVILFTSGVILTFTLGGLAIILLRSNFKKYE